MELKKQRLLLLLILAVALELAVFVVFGLLPWQAEMPALRTAVQFLASDSRDTAALAAREAYVTAQEEYWRAQDLPQSMDTREMYAQLSALTRAAGLREVSLAFPDSLEQEGLLQARQATLGFQSTRAEAESFLLTLAAQPHVRLSALSLTNSGAGKYIGLIELDFILLPSK